MHNQQSSDSISVYSLLVLHILPGDNSWYTRTIAVAPRNAAVFTGDVQRICQ